MATNKRALVVFGWTVIKIPAQRQAFNIIGNSN